MKTKAECLSLAEHYERQAQSLIDQYGDGVRPSWVSTDLGVARYRAAAYRKLAEELKDDPRMDADG